MRHWQDLCLCLPTVSSYSGEAPSARVHKPCLLGRPAVALVRADSSPVLPLCSAGSTLCRPGEWKTGTAANRARLSRRQVTEARRTSSWYDRAGDGRLEPQDPPRAGRLAPLPLAPVPGGAVAADATVIDLLNPMAVVAVIGWAVAAFTVLAKNEDTRLFGWIWLAAPLAFTLVALVVAVPALAAAAGGASSSGRGR